MAITGSGSLAISLYVFVISASFLPKGKLFFLNDYICCLACVLCGAELPQSLQLNPEEYRGEVVVPLRARCAQASP